MLGKAIVVLGLCTAIGAAARPAQDTAERADLRAVARLAGQAFGDAVILFDQASATLDALLVDLAREPNGRDTIMAVIAVRQHLDAFVRTLDQLNWDLLAYPSMQCEADRAITMLQIVLHMPADSWVEGLRKHLDAQDGIQRRNAVLDQQVSAVRLRLTTIESMMSRVREAVADAGNTAESPRRPSAR